MIVILSTETDISTTEVIKWLLHLGVDRHQIIRINDNDSILVEKLVLSNQEDDIRIKIKSTDTCINIHEIKSFWYRRGCIVLANQSTGCDALDSALSPELQSLQQYINFRMETAGDQIGRYSENYISKLHCLKIAAMVGLRIPKTLITEEKKHLNDSLFISKAIKDVVKYKNTEGISVMGTILLNKNFYDSSLPNTFFPTLFQEHMEKLYELRIFFIKNKLFPMAIFSQSNSKTSLDYRNYDREKPNRTVPYSLPPLIRNKIRRFIKKTELTSGSIDMIYTKKEEYCFLEVNPIGQFAQISKPCNYFLEKEIAQMLINSNRTKNETTRL